MAAFTSAGVAELSSALPPQQPCFGACSGDVTVSVAISGLLVGASGRTRNRAAFSHRAMFIVDRARRLVESETT